MAHGGIPASGVLYGRVDGTLILSSSLFPPFPATTSLPDQEGAAFSLPSQEPQPPRFYKLEFTTYDGTADPLNWLNQCEQFFWGQHTFTSDRT
jgi:hypothetical protein